jgi:hypothetical protein
LLHGGRATPASDQFALCVVLYEMLFEQRPFAGANLAELTRHVVAGEIREPNKRVPAHLLAAVRRGLAVDPGARFPSVNALAAALEPKPRVRAGAVAGVGLLAVGGVAVAIFARPKTRRIVHRATPRSARRGTAMPRDGARSRTASRTQSRRLRTSETRSIATSRRGWAPSRRIANRVRAVESDTLFDRRWRAVGRRRQLDALCRGARPREPGRGRARQRCGAAARTDRTAPMRGCRRQDRPSLAPRDRAAALKAQYDLGN